MSDFKGLLQSRTVWSAFVALAAILAKSLGFEFGDADQSALVDAILNTVAAVGSLGAIYFRVKATKVITKA